ncbi:MAG: hypothetical protein AAAC47_18070, partial [Pararhizobium sp.]
MKLAVQTACTAATFLSMQGGLHAGTQCSDRPLCVALGGSCELSVTLSKMGVYTFSGTMGFLFLSTVPLTNGLITQIFGVRYIGILFGFLFFSHQVGSFLGVWGGGYPFEATGSYHAGWIIAIALGVIATLVHWPIDDYPIVRNTRCCCSWRSACQSCWHGAHRNWNVHGRCCR